MLDGLNQSIQLTPQCIATLANRHTGIGFDQCLIIEPSNQTNIDFNYRIFNADGQEVGQCGNGARCLALFAKHYGLTTKTHLTIATHTTQMQLRINQDDSVSVDFGVPQLTPQAIPFIADQKSQDYVLALDNNTTTTIHALSVGNPHAVLLVTDCQSASVASLGKQISTHSRFPEQTNAGFMQIINPNHIMLRVYERGCGETLACGSGAVAAAAVGRLYYGLSNQVTVTLAGGNLTVDWADCNGPITLTGPGVFVYEGTVLL